MKAKNQDNSDNYLVVKLLCGSVILN